jgi:hypothetical protein
MVHNSSKVGLWILPAAAISVLSSGASAEDFSWQISGGYGETELGSNADVERTMLDATYYVDPVDDTRGPYALAPFLNRSGRVTVGVTRDKTSIVTPVLTIGPPPPGTPTTTIVTEETTGFAIGGRYVWSATGWYVGAKYEGAELDREPGSPASSQETTIDGYQLFGGRYFGESTSLDIAAGATRQTSELFFNCITTLCLSGRTATDIDTDDWSIGALHVRRGTRLTYSIYARAASADVTPSSDAPVLTLPSGALPPAPAPGSIVGALTPLPFTTIVAPFTGPLPITGPLPFTPVATPLTGVLPIADERETYAIGGELFPTDRLGFRIGLTRSDGDYSAHDSYDLAATWFFRRAAAVELVLARTEHEIGVLRRESDGAELRLFGRL